MVDINLLIYRGGRVLIESQKRVCQAVVDQLPSVRLTASPDFTTAYRSAHHDGMARLTGHFGDVLNLGISRPVKKGRIEPTLRLGWALTPLGIAWATTVGIYVGLRACLSATTLFALGRSDDARRRLGEHAFEVFWTLRLIESAIQFAVSFFLIWQIGRL